RRRSGRSSCPRPPGRGQGRAGGATPDAVRRSAAGAAEMAREVAAVASWPGTKDREQTALSASPNWPADCNTSGQSKPVLSDAALPRARHAELALRGGQALVDD